MSITGIALTAMALVAVVLVLLMLRELWRDFRVDRGRYGGYRPSGDDRAPPTAVSNQPSSILPPDLPMASHRHPPRLPHADRTPDPGWPRPQPQERTMPEPTEGMQRWQSHRRVHAGRITEVHAGGCYVEQSPEAPDVAVFRTYPLGFTARAWPAVGDYWLVYDDGYQSWCPADQFEPHYTRLPVGRPDVPERP